MFLLVSVRHVGAHPGEHQHGVSIQISINLGKHFFGYLVYKIFLWPESWRESVYMYLLSFPRYIHVSCQLVQNKSLQIQSAANFVWTNIIIQVINQLNYFSYSSVFPIIFCFLLFSISFLLGLLLLLFIIYFLLSRRC